MKNTVGYAVLLFLLSTSFRGAWAAQAEIPGPDNQGPMVCFHCNQSSDGISYRRIILIEEGFHAELDALDQHPSAFRIHDDWAHDEAEWRWAFVHLPTIAGNNQLETGLSGMTAPYSLIGSHRLSEYGIPDVIFRQLFDDVRLAASALVFDGRTSDPSVPFPAAIMLLSFVLIGLIGFRRTVVDA